MIPEIPTKRKRGGQPGSRNSIGNKGGAPHGNCNAKGKKGGGAPIGNHNARKMPKPSHLILLEDYRNCPLAIAWIQENAARLDKANFTADEQRDRAIFAVFIGLTPEALVKSGKEYKYGLYSLTETTFGEDEEMAA